MENKEWRKITQGLYLSKVQAIDNYISQNFISKKEHYKIVEDTVAMELDKFKKELEEWAKNRHEDIYLEDGFDNPKNRMISLEKARGINQILDELLDFINHSATEIIRKSIIK